jgi:hypothetical protein
VDLRRISGDLAKMDGRRMGIIPHRRAAFPGASAVTVARTMTHAAFCAFRGTAHHETDLAPPLR